MPEVVTLYVFPLLAVEVPKAVVCQNQVTPAGGAPTLVNVTPDAKHCGELLVGFPGLAGNGFTVKVAAEVALPPGVVTSTVPVVPAPITAMICVPVLEVMDVTAVPPILTFAAVAPVSPVPFMVIESPTHPLVVPRLVMVGTGAGVYVRIMSSTAP